MEYIEHHNCFAKRKGHVYCIGAWHQWVLSLYACTEALHLADLQKKWRWPSWSCAYKHAHDHDWLHLHRCTWWPGAGGLWLLTMTIEQHALTVTTFDNAGSMRRRIYEAGSGADGGGMASELWESMRQARDRLSKPQGRRKICLLLGESYLERYSVLLQR